MGYLVLTRREGEHLTLRAEPGTDPDDLLAELLVHGITVKITNIDGGRVSVGIDAPAEVDIVRGEIDGA